MKIAICDDEKEFRKNISHYINSYFAEHNIDFECIEFANGESLLSSNQIFDIVFLDIELGDSNGIDIASEIQKQNKNTVILIVTSYHQYLDAAMDLKVTRYIDKPITQQRIFSALDKAMSEINQNIVTLHMKDKRVIRIKQADIVYIEAKLKKVTVYTVDKEYVIKENLKDLHDILTASYFAVPHSSYIVNLNYVRDFKRDEFRLDKPYNKERIFVATRKQAEFKRKFLDFIGEDLLNE